MPSKNPGSSCPVESNKELKCTWKEENEHSLHNCDQGAALVWSEHSNTKRQTYNGTKLNHPIPSWYKNNKSSVHVKNFLKTLWVLETCLTPTTKRQHKKVSQCRISALTTLASTLTIDIKYVVQFSPSDDFDWKISMNCEKLNRERPKLWYLWKIAEYIEEYETNADGDIKIGFIFVLPFAFSGWRVGDHSCKRASFQSGGLAFSCCFRCAPIPDLGGSIGPKKKS